MSVDFTGSSDHQHVTSTKIFWTTLCAKQLDNSYKIRFSLKPAPPSLGSFGVVLAAVLGALGAVSAGCL